MVIVLFARKDSIYKQLGCDVYDIDRDARTWNGGSAAIYHPPCRAWGGLSHMAKPRGDEKELAIWSINMIWKFGGVLEHPRKSKLWPHMNLPMPGVIDNHGGFSILINQSWWGHKAEKKTLLYIKGCKPTEIPTIPISFSAVEYVIGACGKTPKWRRRPEVPKDDREHTPPDLAKWLIELVEIINHKK